MNRIGRGPKEALLKTLLRRLTLRKENFIVAKPDIDQCWVILSEHDTYSEAYDWLAERRSLVGMQILTEADWARDVVDYMKEKR